MFIMTSFCCLLLGWNYIIIEFKSSLIELAHIAPGFQKLGVSPDSSSWGRPWIGGKQGSICYFKFCCIQFSYAIVLVLMILPCMHWAFDFLALYRILLLCFCCILWTIVYHILFYYFKFIFCCILHYIICCYTYIYTTKLYQLGWNYI